jgi:leader peptidase (prepilin peptidase)/N-methyltransferase
MQPVYLSFVFLAGLIFGSFLNVCIYRIPRDLSIVAPRSFCPECGTQLPWPQNIPVLSYLFLRGHCRSCAKPISLRYPLVELTTATLFLLIASRYGVELAAFKWMLFAAILVVLFWTDLEERLLPDECTIGGSIAGLILACFIILPGFVGELVLPDASRRWQSLANAFAGALVLGLPIWAVGALWGYIRKREALGLGDVKLLAMMGIFLGPGAGLLAVTLAAVSGAFIGLILVLWRRKSARNYELPFGSFLCAAAILVVILRMPPGSLLDVL